MPETSCGLHGFDPENYDVMKANIYLHNSYYLVKCDIPTFVHELNPDFLSARRRFSFKIIPKPPNNTSATPRTVRRSV